MPRTRRDVQDTDGEESGRELWTRVLRVPPAGGLARSRGGLRIFSVGVRSKVIGERGVRGTRANARRRTVISDAWYTSLEWKYSVAFESRRERASPYARREKGGELLEKGDKSEVHATGKLQAAARPKRRSHTDSNRGTQNQNLIS